MIIFLLIVIVLILLFGRKAVLSAFGKLGLYTLVFAGLIAAVLTSQAVFGENGIVYLYFGVFGGIALLVIAAKIAEVRNRPERERTAAQQAKMDRRERRRLEQAKVAADAQRIKDEARAEEGARNAALWRQMMLDKQKRSGSGSSGS